MAITRLKLEKFTAFKSLNLRTSPGINIFIGANGTGKTHILKTIYAACDVAGKPDNFAEKLQKVFRPSEDRIGRLVRRAVGRGKCAVTVGQGPRKISAEFSTVVINTQNAKVTGEIGWRKGKLECVYIPVKEMLANAPGFLSLYDSREIHFEEVYADILNRAYRPLLRGPAGKERDQLLRLIQKIIEGKVTTSNQEFFLKNKEGLLEFTLLAEGMRKLALLWVLIQNGVLSKGSVLFWDEPEANLNPRMMRTIAEILLKLQRMGVQIFLATHDYVLLKEFDLQSEKGDKLLFHALHIESQKDGVLCETTDEFLSISPNAIADTFSDLYDRDIERALSSPTKIRKKNARR